MVMARARAYRFIIINWLARIPVDRSDRSRTIEQKCSSSNLPLELVVVFFFFH